MRTRTVLIRVMITAAGVLGGYLYYHFIGCHNGYCPISSNPFISTVYGGAIGILLGFSLTVKTRKNA